MPIDLICVFLNSMHAQKTCRMQQPYLARGRTYPCKMYLVRFWALKHLAGSLIVLCRCGRCFETKKHLGDVCEVLES